MRTLDKGKILTFLLVTVVLSLIQIWALGLILWSSNKPVEVKTLLGDGGVFFFALTLIAISGFTLADKVGSMKKGTADLNITGCAVLFCCLPSILLYASVTSQNISQNPPTANPFGDKWPVQIICALLAVAYAFYAEMRTGSLTKVP